jgi:hypothetical protein
LLLQCSNQGFIQTLKRLDESPLGLAVSKKDKQMYRDELNREAARIVRGRQYFVEDIAAFWRRLISRFGF